MSCHHAPGGLQDLLNEVWSDRPQTSDVGLQNSGTGLNIVGQTPLIVDLPSAQNSKSPENLSPYQLAKKIEKLLDDYIRPMIARDGGNIEIIDIKDLIVYVELSGNCVGCVGAGQTIKWLVEKTLKDQVDERIHVVQV